MSMWETLPLEKENFALKKDFRLEIKKIFVTDFVCIWFVELHSSDVINTVKELNPMLEGDPSKLCDKAMSLFTINENVNYSIVQHINNILLKMVSCMGVVSFNFNVQLSLGDSKMFYDHVTQPFLGIIRIYRGREKYLEQRIKEKDEEIDEYKVEGVQIKRTNLITARYREEELKEESEKLNCENNLLVNCNDVLNSDVNSIYSSVFLKLEELKSQKVKIEVDSSGNLDMTTVSENIEKDKKITLPYNAQYSSNNCNFFTSNTEIPVKKIKKSKIKF